MKNSIINVLLFATGAAVGSLVTWRLLKTKYERIAQEEIDSVKETWARRYKSTAAQVDESEDVEEEWDGDDMTNYHDIAGKYNRSSDESENDEEGGGDDTNHCVPAPYVINPNDFGDGNYDHSLHCLTYYKDGILADDWWVTYDVDETIGEESTEHFGDFEDGVVHVRNERLCADYEVVYDCRTFKEVSAANPLNYNA